MSFVVVAMVSDRSSGPCAFLVAPADLGGQPVSGDYRRSSGQADLGRMGVETTLSRANTVKYHQLLGLLLGQRVAGGVYTSAEGKGYTGCGRGAPGENYLAIPGPRGHDMLPRAGGDVYASPSVHTTMWQGVWRA